MLFTILLTAGCRIYDGPPKDPGTPEPAAHVGTFVSSYGTMTFNGDGKSVTLEVSPEMAALTGLPEGKSEGTYMFMANTPPHVYEYRYDLANELHLTVGSLTVVVNNYLNATDEDTISLYMVNSEGKVEDMLFEKEPA